MDPGRATGSTRPPDRARCRRRADPDERAGQLHGGHRAPAGAGDARRAGAATVVSVRQLVRIRPATGIAGAALLLAVVTVAARVVGFGRVLVFAHTVGPSCLGDTYYTANTVPNIFFDIVVGGALSSLAVPIPAGPIHADDHERADRIASALLTWVLLLMVPVMLLGLALARPVMDLLVGNGHPGCAAAMEQQVGARMLIVFMPQVLLYGAAVVGIGVLQAHRRFLGPATAPLLSSAVVIASYLLFASVA